MTPQVPSRASAGETLQDPLSEPRTAWAFPPSRILVPVDFGDASAAAIAVGGVLADRYHAALTALHAEIIEAPVYFTHEQAAAIERGRVAARSTAERELMQFVRRRTRQAAVVRFVEEAPAIAVIDAARSADLIVMGTHGRRGPSRWWLGSVAERVVSEAQVPVLVVRGIHAQPAPDAVFRRPLMVAGPWTLESDAARYAGGLAAAFDGMVAERAAACQEDLVREREASVLVIAHSPGAGGRFGVPGERLIRSCSLPMLFVPNRRNARPVS